MKVRDLPHDLALAYCKAILSDGLPAEWLDLPFIEFCSWFEASRIDKSLAISRWNVIRRTERLVEQLVVPIFEKCPPLTLAEVMEILPEHERAAIKEAVAMVQDPFFAGRAVNPNQQSQQKGNT